MFSLVSSLAGTHKASRDGPLTSRTDTNRHEITEPSYTTSGDTTRALPELFEIDPGPGRGTSRVWRWDYHDKQGCLVNGRVVERFEHQGDILAIVIRADYESSGIEFFTDNDSSQQLGYMRRPEGYIVDPHRHNPVERAVTQTQEVLFIRGGRCRLNLYGSGDTVIMSTELLTGDVVLLASGGHGLLMLEETEIIEVKQGPFSGDHDKTRFEPRS